MRISDWSSDVCSSDLRLGRNRPASFDLRSGQRHHPPRAPGAALMCSGQASSGTAGCAAPPPGGPQDSLTEVELTWIEGRLEQWIRFGRITAERILSRSTKRVDRKSTRLNSSH